MTKRFWVLVFVLICICGIISVQAASFSDVASEDWYADSVSDVCARGYMIGTAEAYFSPLSPITGAEGLTLLARVHADIQGKTAALTAVTAGVTPWYRGYIDYCADQGLLSEKAAEILDVSLSKPLSRAELLYLLSALPDALFSARNTVDDGMIPDVDMSAFYASAVYRAYRAGITVGVDAKGTFRPDAQITRAEVAAILVRIADSSKRLSRSLPFDVQALLNNTELHPVTTGYTVLDRMVDAVFAKALTDDMTTYEKVLALYDYLVENGSYGRSPVSGNYHPIYKKNPYTDPSPTYPVSYIKAFSGYRGYEYYYIAEAEHALEGYTAMYAAEMLDAMTGWCDHYSSAFVILCRRLGLDTVPVYINSRLGNEYKPHMTTVMRVGGVDCVFDPQIEAVLVGNTGKNEHKRFCRPISEMTEEYRDWDDLSHSRALMGDFTYNADQMKAVNKG